MEVDRRGLATPGVSTTGSLVYSHRSPYSWLANFRVPLRWRARFGMGRALPEKAAPSFTL
jgi:hypothetical protein